MANPTSAAQRRCDKRRGEKYETSAYLTDGQALLAPSDSTLSKVTDIRQLCGLTVGTGAGTTFQTILTSNAAKCAAAGKKPYAVQYFSDNAAIWLGLANGRIDVGFVTAKGSPLADLVTHA